MTRRVPPEAWLHNPATRREMMIRIIMAAGAREGIQVTEEQAAAAYDKVQSEKENRREDHH